jgi:hypothetical protein
LKTTEADTKNVFGRYGSQRMKDWQEIIRLYEKDSLYLGEASQILVRNVSYEIPGLRKQISKFEQLSEEAEKKIGELIKSEHNLQTEYNALCSQLGIKGDNVRDELIAKLNELPDLFQTVNYKITASSLVFYVIFLQIAVTFPTLAKAIQFYAEFSGNKNSIPLLRHISLKGNTTVYEFLYNEPPLSIEEPPLKIKISTDNKVDDDKVGKSYYCSLKNRLYQLLAFRLTLVALKKSISVSWPTKKSH